MNDPLAAILREIKRRDGLTLTEMARLIGVDNGYLSYVLSGKRRVGRKILDGAGRRWPEVLVAHAQSLKMSHTTVATTPPGETRESA